MERVDVVALAASLAAAEPAACDQAGLGDIVTAAQQLSVRSVECREHDRTYALLQAIPCIVPGNSASLRRRLGPDLLCQAVAGRPTPARRHE